jgi:hypothetical protein
MFYVFISTYFHFLVVNFRLAVVYIMKGTKNAKQNIAMHGLNAWANEVVFDVVFAGIAVGSMSVMAGAGYVKVPISASFFGIWVQLVKAAFSHR